MSDWKLLRKDFRLKLQKIYAYIRSFYVFLYGHKQKIENQKIFEIFLSAYCCDVIYFQIDALVSEGFKENFK